MAESSAGASDASARDRAESTYTSPASAPRARHVRRSIIAAAPTLTMDAPRMSIEHCVCNDLPGDGLRM